jgi:toxin CcdB
VMPLAISTMESDDGPRRLSPMIAINGRSYALIPFEAAPLDKRMLKRKAASIRNYASEVVAAMDAVMSGI